MHDCAQNRLLDKAERIGGFAESSNIYIRVLQQDCVPISLLFI